MAFGQLHARQVQRFFRRGFSQNCLLEANGIVPDGMERIGDILKCGEHRLPVLRRGLVEARLRGPLPLLQGEAVEDGLRCVREPGVEKELRAGAEQICKLRSLPADVAVDGELRQPVGDGDANQSAGRVHVFLRRAHIRPLHDQIGGKAYRQEARQLEARKLEPLRQALARKMTGKHDQRVPLECQRLAERRQCRFGLRDKRLLSRDVQARCLPQVFLQFYFFKNFL